MERPTFRRSLPKFAPLPATSRGAGEVFPNDEEREKNEKHPVVHKRVNARKALHFHENKDERKLPDEMTVAEAGIAPLDHIAVEYDTPEGQS